MNVPVPVKVLLEGLDAFANCGTLMNMPAMKQISTQLLSQMVAELPMLDKFKAELLALKASREGGDGGSGDDDA